MPATSDVSVETKEVTTLSASDKNGSTEKLSKEPSSLESLKKTGHFFNKHHQQQQQQQQPYNGSPHRKFNNRTMNMNGNRQNHNHTASKKPPSDSNNNNVGNGSNKNYSSYKGSNMTQQKMMQGEYHQNQKHSNGHMSEPPKKTPTHKMPRSITKAGPHYFVDDSQLHHSPSIDGPHSMPPSFPAEFHGENANNGNQHTPENDLMHRKYSIDFLHQVGYKMNVNGLNMSAQHSPKTPKHVDDPNLMALKMALGDNSGYYTHFYAGGMYGNQMMIQQQQYQNSNYSRYQQQQEIQRLQRIYQRGQDNYQQQRVYHQSVYLEDSSPVPCQCPPIVQQQRSYHQSGSYTQSSTYHNRNKSDRREYRDTSKKHRHAFGYQNGGNSNGDRPHNKKDFRGQLNKSHSFNAEDTNKRQSQDFTQTNSDDQAYRSLSPTPPNSSKSSSPGVQDKFPEKDTTASTESNLELADDSISTASSSGPSFNGDMKVSRSAPILTVPEEPTKNVNLWIDNNFGSAFHNGLSHSAEHLSFREAPITIIKRPPSANETKRHSQHQIVRSASTPSYDPQYPFEYYLSRANESEMIIAPPDLRCGSQWDRLSEQMWQKFRVSQQSQETYSKKMILWQDLHNAMKNFPLFHQKAFPKWGLYLVGSTISGFGSDSSDIDMCLVSKGSYHLDPRVDPRMEAMVTLNDLKNYLMNSMTSFQHFSLINAKVPILRFRDPSNKIEIDLNYNNCIGVRNTHLLFSYTQLDWRLRPLALIVKLWANYHNINDARNSTISSYSLVLMVIHFMQCGAKPAILPCLHQLCPEKFHQLHDITTIDMVEKCDVNWKTENRQPLGELFLRFLDYYSNFDYANQAISIRTGGLLPIEECKNARSLKNDPNHWQTLCIEEPFDLTNTARSAYDYEIFVKVKEVFFQSWHRLKESRSLDSVFSDPLFTAQQQQFISQMNQMKFMMGGAATTAVTSSNDTKS